jgi:hypothetical protein
MRISAAARLTSPLVSLLLASGCRPAIEAPPHHLAGLRITLASDQSRLIPEPFVSVLDSVWLTITPQDAEVIFKGKRLVPGDTNASFDVPIPEGLVGFEAGVVSTNHALLFSGATSQTIDRDGGRIGITLFPRSSVLVIAPSTATAIPSQGRLIASTVLYNRGIGVLAWSVQDTMVIYQTPCRVRCLSPKPLSGLIPAGDSVVFVGDSVLANSPPISVTITTKQGDVTLMMRPP